MAVSCDERQENDFDPVGKQFQHAPGNDHLNSMVRSCSCDLPETDGDVFQAESLIIKDVPS